MNPLIGAAIGAGAGLLKSELIDKPNEIRDRIMQSITDRYSPWTGRKGVAPERVNPLETAIAGGVQGLGLGQDMASADQGKSLLSKAAQNLRGGEDKLVDTAVQAAQGGGNLQVAPATAAQEVVTQAAPAPQSDIQSGSLSGDDLENALKKLRIAFNNRRLMGVT